MFYSLSRHDRIIVMLIHQPRYSIFKLFDSVRLLSSGELVYNGPACAVVSYFTNVLGMTCMSLMRKICHNAYRIGMLN